MSRNSQAEDRIVPRAAQLVEMLSSLGAYARLPRRLKHLYREAPSLSTADIFGAEDRLRAIEATLRGRHLGEIADLGGHSGYFSLSLLDAEMATCATVYDLSPNALGAGRLMADEMGLGARVEYVNQAIDLEFLKGLRAVDTIICLNLLHHAGARFDVDDVAREGWGDYARKWLRELRTKCRVAILGFGFELAKPKHWNVPHHDRAAHFARSLEDEGWTILYDANVKDIQVRGVEAANNRGISKRRLSRLRSKKWERFAKRVRGMATGRLFTPLIDRHFDKRYQYHLYIVERTSSTAEALATPDRADTG